MIIGSNHSKTNNFKLKINHNTISQTNNVKYLRVFLDLNFSAPEARFLNLDIMFLFPS